MDPLTQRIFCAGGATTSNYWINEISGAAGLVPAQLTGGANGNPRCLLNSNSGSYVLQFNANGLITSQRQIVTNSTGKMRAMVADGSGVTYLVGEDFLNSTVGNCSIYGSLNEASSVFSGSYEHYTSIGNAVNNGYSDFRFSFSGFNFSVPGEPIACGYTTPDNYSTFNAYVKKIGSWEKSLAANTLFSGGMVTSNQDAAIYLVGATGSSLNTPILVKYNTSGTLEWTRTIGSGGGSEALSGISGGGSSQSVVGSTKSVRPGFSDPLVFQLNSSGGINWQKALVAASGSNTGAAVSEGGNGEIRIAAQWGNGIMIARYFNNGDLMYQRLLTHSTYTLIPKRIALNGTYVELLASISGSDTVVLCRLSDYGSTGTYGGYTYTTGTGTDTATSLTTSSISISEVSKTPLGSGSYDRSYNPSSLVQSQLLIP